MFLITVGKGLHLLLYCH